MADSEWSIKPEKSQQNRDVLNETVRQETAGTRQTRAVEIWTLKAENADSTEANDNTQEEVEAAGQADIDQRAQLPLAPNDSQDDRIDNGPPQQDLEDQEEDDTAEGDKEKSDRVEDSDPAGKSQDADQPTSEETDGETDEDDGDDRDPPDDDPPEMSP